MLTLSLSLFLSFSLSLSGAILCHRYVGLYGGFGYFFRWIPPLIYLGIVQATDNQQIAFISIAAFMVIALVLVLFVDLKQVGGTGRLSFHGSSVVCCERRWEDEICRSPERIFFVLLQFLFLAPAFYVRLFI